MVATSQSAEYDPWVDLNDDGKIDIFDVVGMTSRYGATGDSAKNVTMAGHATKLAYFISGQSVSAGSSWTSGWIHVGGYSKVTICLYTSALECLFRLDAHHNGLFAFYVDYQNKTIYHNFVKTYDVPSELIQIFFLNHDSMTRVLSFDVYLIA
jgi:hypothetical protein